MVAPTDARGRPSTDMASHRASRRRRPSAPQYWRGVEHLYHRGRTRTLAMSVRDRDGGDGHGRAAVPAKRITRNYVHQHQLAEQCRVLKLPVPEFEYQFAKASIGRLWKLDCAWLLDRPRVTGDGLTMRPPTTPSLRHDHLIAVEIDGGGFIPGGGRHSRGPGMREDCEKYWEAAIHGWTVLRVLPEHVKKGQAVRWIERLFKDRGIIP